jgi:L-lactate dehydrogenase complex protein LldE
VKVALFITCLADQLFPEVGESVVRILQRHGCTVTFPEAQLCCGQPAFNSGYREEARRVASLTLDAFEDAEYVVSPSGSCSGMIAHYYPELFAEDPVQLERARRLARKTYEFSAFLVNVLGVTDVAARFPARVTYHASCHGSRLLGVKNEPLALLGAVRELELVPLPRCEDCCGFGGTFSVKLSELSSAMVDEKIEHVLETGADYLVGTDMGCLMNIDGRLRRRGLPVRTLHLAQLLDGAVVRGDKPK